MTGGIPMNPDGTVSTESPFVRSGTKPEQTGGARRVLPRTVPMRLTERKTPDGWARCEFEDLKVGDVFRLLRSDGTADDPSVWVVREAPTPDEPPAGNWMLKADRAPIDSDNPG